MANKSSKSPTGEDREAPNQYQREQETETDDIRRNTTAVPEGQGRPEQENQKNRGYQEDQPHNPVRSSGSTASELQSMPAGEPDRDEQQA